jgi:hypothetical protein
VLRDQLPHFRIAAGFLIHHMAPVAPHGFQVEQHEPVFVARALEYGFRPGLPLDGGGGGRHAGGT